MRSAWAKPELYVENYELTQVVAAGCGTKVEVTKDTVVTVGCAQGGNGHWSWTGTYEELAEVADKDGNGNINWDEFKAATGTANNGIVTGDGHANHAKSVTINGVEITDKPFNS